MNTADKKIVNVKARLFSDQAVYPGTIESLSNGVLYVTAASKKPSHDFMPGSMLQVNFHSQTGETSLACKVKWSYKTPPHGVTDSLGVELLKDDNEYEALLQVL